MELHSWLVPTKTELGRCNLCIGLRNYAMVEIFSQWPHGRRQNMTGSSHAIRENVPVTSITQNKVLYVDAKDYNEGGPNQAHTPPGKGSKG
nr:hypothetical protein Iba_chr05fCG8480 [Ipomoea batatas]